MPICSLCDHVHLSTRSQSPFQWRCVKFPAEPKPALQFISPTYRPDPPYDRCIDHNLNGDCTKFQPLRQGAKE